MNLERIFAFLIFPLQMSAEDQELLDLQNSAPIRYLDMYQSEDQVLLRTARHYAVNFPKLYYKMLREKNARISADTEKI